MKRIGIISWDYDYPKGGLGKAMQALSATLRELGCEVSVLTPRRTKGSPFLFSFILFFITSRWIRHNRIDVVIFPVGPGGIFLLKKIRGVRSIAISYHTYGQQSRDVPGESWKRIFVPFEQRTLQLADRILCYSRDTETFLAKNYYIPSKQTLFCTQLLPQSLFSDHDIVKQKGLAVAVLRLDQRKGVDTLLRAWPMIQKKNQSAHLLIVGDGTMREEVKKFQQSFPSVERRERVSEEELRSLTARAEIAFCPAYLEGFGLAAAEAMLLGTALVASDADGLRSLVKHGILFPPGNAAALASAAQKLFADDSLRANLARAAKTEMRKRFAPVLARRDLMNALS